MRQKLSTDLLNPECIQERSLNSLATPKSLRDKLAVKRVKSKKLRKSHSREFAGKIRDFNFLTPVRHKVAVTKKDPRIDDYDDVGNFFLEDDMKISPEAPTNDI